MSLEQRIQELTDAIVVLNATIKASGTAAPAAIAKTPAPAEKVKAATAKPTAAENKAAAAAPVEKTVTQADIQAAGADLTILADLDRAAAVGILQEFGVAKMTAAKPELIPQIHAKVKAKIAELQGGAAQSLV